MKTHGRWIIVLTAFVTGCTTGGKTAPPTARPTPVTAEAMTPKAAGVEPVVAVDPSFREARGAMLPEIPPFPAYPGATLVGSAERNRPNEAKQGHTIKWTTTDSVAKVMAWYQSELPRQGWTYTSPSDGASSEQTARIRRGNITGSITVEAGKQVTEIEVDLGRK